MGRRNQRKQKSSDNCRLRYYDACTLDKKANIYQQILNNKRRYNIISIVSHLSLGEAYCNCLLKGEETANAFIELITKFNGFMRAVGNYQIEDELGIVAKTFTNLSATDMTHLATALTNRCEMLKTFDKDLLGLNKKKIKNICDGISLPFLAIGKP